MSEKKQITLKEIFDEIIKTRAELNNSIEVNKVELKNIIEASEISTSQKIEELNSRVRNLEEENQSIKSYVETLERKLNKSNILIFGLNKPVKERTVSYFCEQIKELLEVDIKEEDIKDLYSLGNQPNSPLKIEFIGCNKKKQIFKNVRKLKNTNIGIANDLTSTQRKENKYLRERLGYYRETEKEKCYIKGETLYIGTKGYTRKELELLEENIENRLTNSAPTIPTSEAGDGFEFQLGEESNQPEVRGVEALVTAKGKNIEAVTSFKERLRRRVE